MTFISPMLLETADSPFDSADHIFEPKIDGHRLILSHIDGKARLFTRHNNECTRQYPELIPEFGYDVILDGEVAATDPETGAVCFESVMERFSAGKADKILRLAAKCPANFVVFDILRLRGKDLRGLPLIKRKEILADLALPSSGTIAKIPYFERKGTALFNQIVARKMEGIVAKRRESVYVSARSSAWLKVINWSYAEVYITGYRKNEFGLLVAVKEDDGQLRQVGIIEFGVAPSNRKAFYGVVKSLVMNENSEYVFIEPRIQARVKMRNWTRSGMLRSPVFVKFII